MKCLLIAINFPPIVGGSATVYHNLCKYGGGAVVVLTACNDRGTGAPLVGCAEHDAAASYTVHRVPSLVAPPPPPAASGGSRLGVWWRRLWRDLPTMVRVLREVAALVRREDIDVICVGELVHGGWLGPAGKYLLRRKVIYYVHGEELTHGARSLSNRLKRAYLTVADGVVAVSEFTRGTLVEMMNVAPERIVVIHNGVDLTRFRPMAPPPDLIARYGLAGAEVVLSVGRLVPRKGFDRVILALPAILARRPSARYLVVGEGPYRAKLERLAADAGVSERVVFTGAVPDAELTGHYALGRVFAMPNREIADGDTEGFGLVFLEANACGKPVVAGRAGGVGDAVRHGINGLMVDGTVTEAVADAIVRVLEDNALHARLSAGGLAAARALDWQARTGRFLDVCRGIAAGDPPR